MKSSFELAMEKFDDEPVQKLSDDQKERIAEIGRKYQSKMAEAEVMSQDKIKKLRGQPEAIEQIQNDFAVERASLREKGEAAKEKVRKGEL